MPQEMPKVQQDITDVHSIDALRKEVLRLQVENDNLKHQREMLQKEIFKAYGEGQHHRH